MLWDRIYLTLCHFHLIANEWLFFSQTPSPPFMIIFPFIPTVPDGFSFQIEYLWTICLYNILDCFSCDAPNILTIWMIVSALHLAMLKNMKGYVKGLGLTNLKSDQVLYPPTLHNLRVDTIVPFLGWFVHSTTLWVKFLTSYTDIILIVQVA